MVKVCIVLTSPFLTRNIKYKIIALPTYLMNEKLTINPEITIKRNPTDKNP